MKHPRTIVAKALFNPDEFVDFSSECASADVPQSRQLRDLAKGWVADRKATRERQQRERPSMSQNMAMFLPGRANYGARAQFHVRV